MTTEELNQLIEKHKATTSEREKAKIEADIWAGADPETRQTVGRRRFIKQHFPKIGQTAELRSLLFNAGEEIEALWKRIEDPEERMLLPTAVGRLKDAQEHVKTSGVSLAEGVELALKEYDSWPWSKTKTGRKYRKRPLSQARGDGKPRRKKQLSEESIKKFWQNLREDITSFIDRRLSGVDPRIAQGLRQDFCVELQILTDGLSHKIDRAKRTANASATVDKAIKFAHVREACEVLGIDAPTAGRLDKPAIEAFLDRAKQNKRRLANSYHSDKVGDDSKRDQFEAVMAAYDTVEEYMESLNNG